jgi:subtilase family serine protease
MHGQVSAPATPPADKEGCMRKRWIMGVAGSGLVATSLFAIGSVGLATGQAASSSAVAPLARYINRPFAPKAPTTAECEAQLGYACYSPKQFETAYDMKSLYKKGDTGKGETIALIDSFGSPTITQDLKTFDTAFGLPAPPSFKIIQPAGKVPKFNPKNGLMVSWAVETSLDVEYAHAMAPGANLIEVETPVAETIGVHGFPQIVQAENYVIDHKMANVISQSLATAEVSFPSPKDILKLRSAYINAEKHHVTVLGAAGDWGATSPSDASESTYYTHATANWPASDPLVTAVGGLQLHLNAEGQRLLPDNVWNDTSFLGSPAAGGGTVSDVFARPSYQNSVKNVVGAWRGVPDISMSAAVDGGSLVYMSFKGLDGPGFYVVGGTSEASPLFAGVVAVADQYAGHPLGFLNPALYKLAAEKAPGIVDITIGENTVTFTQGGKDYTVPGYVAVPGYDLASGLGTIDGAKFVPEIAKAAS